MRRYDEVGGSAVEYGLLIAGIATMIAAVVFMLGGMVQDTLFDPGCDKLAGQIASANGGDANCDN